MSPDREWIIKGSIDIERGVYPVARDTKVISKLIETLLLPQFHDFASRNGLQLLLPSKQNFYPDMTFRDAEGYLHAVDLKSSYYKGDTVNGMTLGSYWGYFRNRGKVMNMDFPYGSYASHIIVGVLYQHSEGLPDGLHSVALERLETIRSVICNLIVFCQPKWKVASDIPGSGNTRNIGSVREIAQLLNGTGPFATLGEEVFDHYWMNYFNRQDSLSTLGIDTPRYYNLATYRSFLEEHKDMLSKL